MLNLCWDLESVPLFICYPPVEVSRFVRQYKICSCHVIGCLLFILSRVPVFVLPPIPQDPSNDLMEWFDESRCVFNSLKDIMLEAYLKRIERFNEMSTRAGDVFWWPFTQHKFVPASTVTVIDSRYGENFSVYKVCVVHIINDRK